MAGKGRDKKCERRDTVHLPPTVGSATAQASFCTQSVFHNSSVQVVVFKQVPVQLRTSADSVTLLVFAAECRAAADIDQHSRICQGRMVQQLIDVACPRAGPTAANPLHAVAAVNRWDRQTDAGHFHRPCSAYCVSTVIQWCIGGYTSYTNLRVFLTAYTHLSDHK